MRKGAGGGGLYASGPGSGLLQTSMVQHHPQRSNSGGGSGGGGARIFVSSHQPHQQGATGGQMGPYAATAAAAAALHQSGILLQHHHQQQQQHHPHHHPHQHHPQHQRASGQFSQSGPGGPAGAPLIPNQFQQQHPHSHHHHQFGSTSGPGVSLVNSHYSQQPLLSSSPSGGGGIGGSGSPGERSSSHSNSIGPGSGGCGGVGGGGGDMPPVETVVARLETACRLLHGIGGNNTRVNEISSEIQILSEDLRRVGSMLENTYPEVLDRVMSSMRDASAQPCLPPSLRLAIFELVELRASKWLLPSDSSNYYRQRRNLNDATDAMDERRVGSNNVSVVVTNCTGSGGNPIKPEAIFPPGSSPPLQSTSPNVVAQVVETPAKTYREEIVIKNSDSGKVAPTAKERVLSINGYSQQSINLAKQLIQETITRNASPVLEGMVLPSTSCSEFPDISGLEDAADINTVAASLKRMQIQSSSAHSTGNKLDHHHNQSHNQSSSSSSHFSYTVTLGDHSIKILGDDLQYVQEAKMALDDYFLQKYPDLFCASNSIEDEDQEEGDDLDENFVHRYDRETLLSLSGVQTPEPDFSHLEPDIRANIVLDKRREFDPEKFTRDTSSTSSSSSNNNVNANANPSTNNKAGADILPG